MSVNTEGCPGVLILQVMEDLEGKVVVMKRMTGWRGVRGDEGGEGGGGRSNDGHGD